MDPISPLEKFEREVRATLVREDDPLFASTVRRRIEHDDLFRFGEAFLLLAVSTMFAGSFLRLTAPMLVSVWVVVLVDVCAAAYCWFKWRSTGRLRRKSDTLSQKGIIAPTDNFVPLGPQRSHRADR